MKRILQAIAVTAILAGCSRSTAIKYTLSGSDPSFIDGKYMYILSYIGTTDITIDSARIQNTAFTMKGTYPYPMMAYLYMGKDENGAQISEGSFILEKGSIRLEKQGDSFLLIGTPLNDRLHRFSEKIAALEQNGRPEAIDSLYLATERENRNMFGLSLMVRLLQTHTGQEIAQMADSLPASLQQHPALLELRATIAGLRTDIGKPYIDIVGRTPDGDSISLAGVVRKPGNRYLLVDFGALWCGFCRDEFPNLTALYEKYRDCGFDIFGISFDVNRKRWLECIETYNMHWPQIHPEFGLHPRQTQAWRDYSLDGIPASYLIDCQTGLIIAKNLRGEILARKIAALLD